MKPINKAALKVLAKITEDMDKIGDHRKLDNAPGAFMPLSVEVIGKHPERDLLVLSLAHYYEQNCDLMRDPEVVFLYQPGRGAWPVVFIQDNLGIYQESAVEFNSYTGTYKGYYRRQQADLVVFCSQWFENIKQQQF